MLRGEIEVAVAAVIKEFLSHLGDDNPVLAVPEQLPQSFFTAAVGRCGVDQVQAQVPGLGDQIDHCRVIGNGKGTGVFYALVAADFHRAQTEGADG